MQRACFSSAAAAASVVRFGSALRQLQRHGVQALQPTPVPVVRPSHGHNSTNTKTPLFRWQKPVVSRRVARVLRKQAIVDGSYYNKEDNSCMFPVFDEAMARAQGRGQGRLPQLRVPKKASRQRTREERALKLERNMIGMDDRMQELWASSKGKKPPPSFENLYKSLTKINKK
jgi:hypothetical protein